MHVAVVTIPPVPVSFVIMADPSGNTSAIGEPMLSSAGTSLNPGSAKYPPVTCGPHSRRCAIAVPAPSICHSLSPQPNLCRIQAR